MSKSETMTTDTGKAGEPAALTDKDLEAVSGGEPISHTHHHLHHGPHGHRHSAQMIQQIMQQQQQGD